jgi:hypothetical protein
MKGVIYTAALALCLVGCGDDLDPAWKVKGFRVFGARIENLSTTAPSRLAEAAPGDMVRLSLASLDPSASTTPPQVFWVFCAQTARAGGTFGCDPASATFGMGATTLYQVPRMMLGLDPLGRARVQGVAVVCAGGTVTVDPMTRQPRCEGQSATTVTMVRSIVVNTTTITEGNRNPELTEAVLLRNGNERDSVTLGTTSMARVPRCASDPCPDHVIELRVSPESREMYRTVDIRANPVTQPERLQFGYFVTGGEMELTFYVDIAERPMGPVRNKWRAPRAAGVVTLLFSVQDVRGGYDWIQRSVMVE